MTIDLLSADDSGGRGPASSCGSGMEAEPAGLGALERDDVVDSQGTRWRSFGTAPHDGRVNMSVLEPFLRVLSHGGTRTHARASAHDIPKT